MSPLCRHICLDTAVDLGRRHPKAKLLSAPGRNARLALAELQDFQWLDAHVDIASYRGVGESVSTGHGPPVGISVRPR